MAESVTRMNAVKRFIEKDTLRPVQTSEFMAFWKACTEDERQDFGKSAAASMGFELLSQ